MGIKMEVENKTIQEDIRRLVSYGRKTGLVCEEDVIYTTNRLLELFGLEELEETDKVFSMKESELEEFTDSVIANQQRLLNNNFVPLSRQDILDIYTSLY